MSKCVGSTGKDALTEGSVDHGKRDREEDRWCCKRSGKVPAIVRKDLLLQSVPFLFRVPDSRSADRSILFVNGACLCFAVGSSGGGRDLHLSFRGFVLFYSLPCHRRE